MRRVLLPHCFFADHLQCPDKEVDVITPAGGEEIVHRGVELPVVQSLVAQEPAPHGEDLLFHIGMIILLS